MNHSLISFLNCSQITVKNFFIISSFFQQKTLENHNGILFNLYTSFANLTDFKLCNNTFIGNPILSVNSDNYQPNSYANFENFLIENTNIKEIPISEIFVFALFIKNINFFTIKSFKYLNNFSKLTHFHIEKCSIFHLQNSSFHSILTKKLIILSEISSISLQNCSFNSINNPLNLESSTILYISDSPLITLTNFSCRNSFSFSSTTCLSLTNLNTNSLISLKNSLFFNNTAQYTSQSLTSQGVSLYSSLAKGSFLIENCEFSWNNLQETQAFSSAPCFFSNSQEDFLNISRSSFTNNTSSFAETCLSYHGFQLAISDSDFSYNINQLLDSTSNAALTSGALYLFVISVSFHSNKATNGAAILMQNTENKAYTFAEFKNLYVFSNIAVYSPILFSSNIQIFSISFENSVFRNNTGLIKGGVFQTWYALYGNILTFSSCLFVDNIASSSGGVAYIANLGNELIFFNCTFMNNQAKYEGGGAINMYGDPNTIVKSQICRFIQNKAPTKGGVFLITTGIYLDNSSYFLLNSADEGGLIAINFFSVLLLENSEIFNSTATSGAGLLKLMGQSDVSLRNLTIKYSYAAKGGVFVTGGLSVLRVYSCVFEGNEALNATIMYATNTAYEIIIEDSVFSNNKGSRNAFELSSCVVLITNCEFRTNEINLFYIELSVLSLIHIKIIDLHCKKGQFGCVMNILSKSLVEISDSLVKNVTSEETQGNIISIISNLTIRNTEIREISIGFRGDLLYSQQSFINISYISLQEFSTIPIYLEKSSIYFENSNISQKILNISSGSGSISCVNCLFFSIYNVSFLNISNLNKYSGAITILGSSKSSELNFSVVLCRFEKNFGVFGGGIFVNNSNISIINSSFLQNSARFGGGVYLYCQITLFCTWNIHKNVFERNMANVSGGAIRWEPYVPKNADYNRFIDNSAFFGADLASQPIRFSVISGEKLEQFKGFKSGNITTEFSLYLLDYYQQIVKGLDGLAIIKLEYADSSSSSDTIIGLMGSQIVSFMNNSFTFNDLTLVATPNTSIYLKITSPLIPYYYSSLLQASHLVENLNFIEIQNSKTSDYTFQIIVEMRVCQIGEIYNPKENKCNLCPYGQYSFDPKELSCHDCPVNGLCFGGCNVSINTGFWRSHVYSTEIYHCFMPQICLGGLQSECFEGYTGPLCDVCRVDDNVQFYKFGGTSCDDCANNNSLGYVIFFLFYALMIFYVFFTIKKNLDSVNTVETLNYEMPVFLKIGMDYIQVISTISLLNVRWPASFSGALTTLGSAGNLNSILFPFECVLARIPIRTNVFYLKIFMGSFFAWFNFIFSSLVWVVYMKIKRKVLQFFKKEIIITIIVVGFTLQPSIVNMYFTAINCIEINGIFYVKKQLTLKCWEGEHLKVFYFFILPSLLLWSIILPLICFIYVKRNIKSNDYQTRASLIYITKGVRLDYYYWEFIMMAKRYCISMVSAFLISDLTLAISMILLIIMFFFFWHLYLKPYNLIVFNTLQDFSFYSSFMVFFFCLYYVVDQEEKSQLICLIFLCLGISIFFVRFAKHIFKAYSEKLKVIISKLESYVSSKKKLNLHPKKSIKSTGSKELKLKEIIMNKSSGHIRKNEKPQNNEKKVPLKTLKVVPMNLRSNKAKANQLKTHEINLKIEIKKNPVD